MYLRFLFLLILIQSFSFGQAVDCDYCDPDIVREEFKSYKKICFDIDTLNIKESTYEVIRKHKCKDIKEVAYHNLNSSTPYILYEIVDNDTVFITTEVYPQYIDKKPLEKYITENIRYPKAAIKDKIEGRVYISFAVSKTGKVCDAKIIKGVHPILDQEALRVFSYLPDFEPGQYKGKNVKVRRIMPIYFKLP